MVVSPPVGSLDELPPDDFILVTPGGFMSPSSQDRILVFDLGMFDIRGVADWLEHADSANLNATVVALGTAEQLAHAQAQLARFDVTFIEKPGDLPDEKILQFLYDQLGSVYAPFRRHAVQFVPHSAEEHPQSRQPESAQQQILSSIFGEHADTVEPVSSEIDPAYSHPPMAFTAAEHEQLLAHLRRPETEETDSE